MTKLGDGPRPEAFAKAWAKGFAKAVRDEANARGRLTEAGARRIAERTDALRRYGDDAALWLEENGQRSVKADKLISAAYERTLHAAEGVAGANRRISLGEAESLPPTLVSDFYVLRGKDVPSSGFAKRARDAAPAMVSFVKAMRAAQGAWQPTDEAIATEFFDKAKLKPVAVPAGVSADRAIEVEGPAAKNLLGGRYLVLLDADAKLVDLAHVGANGVTLRKNLQHPEPVWGPAAIASTIAAVASDYGLTGGQIQIDATEASAQATELLGTTDFAMALRSALDSFIGDGDDPESPLGLVETLPEGPWTQPDPRDTVRWFLSRPSTTLHIVPRSGDEPPPAEHGESVASNWIFYAYLGELSDHGHWAVVSRNAESPTYNYGFN